MASNLAPGTYTCYITDAKGCTTQIQAIIENAIGIEDPAIQNIAIYPNPTSGRLNVSFSASGKEIYTLKVVDLIGNVLISKVNTTREGANVQELDLTGFAKGIYFLTIEREGAELKTIKISVE